MFQIQISCSCPRDQKIPRLELQWVQAQREKRGRKSRFSIDSNDKKESMRLNKMINRKLKIKSRNTLSTAEPVSFDIDNQEMEDITSHDGE